VKKFLKRTTMLKERVLVVTSCRLELKDNLSPHWRTSHLQTEAALHFAMKKLSKRMRISQGRVLKSNPLQHWDTENTSPVTNGSTVGERLN
jgi:hypothetical protein